MNNTNIEIKKIFISFFIFYLAFFIHISYAQTKAHCDDLEYLKLTENGLECIQLPGRESKSYIEHIIETIVNPNISPLPESIPTCGEDAKYIFQSDSWGCRAEIDTSTQIEFIGCPTGEYLTKITGGITCGLGVPEYALENHAHQVPICVGVNKALQYNGRVWSCVTILLSSSICRE